MGGVIDDNTTSGRFVNPSPGEDVFSGPQGVPNPSTPPPDPGLSRVTGPVGFARGGTEESRLPRTSGARFSNVLGHNFWTNRRQSYDPKAQFRFIVRIPGMGLEDSRPNPGDQFADRMDESFGAVWYARSIDKPGYSVKDVAEGRYFNSSTKAEPIPKVETPDFKKVTMTLIDPVYPNATRKLLRYLRRGGFQEQKAYETAMLHGGPSTSFLNTNLGGDATGPVAQADLRGFPRVEIDQLDSEGNRIESWTLLNAFPQEVDFGKLDYSSDDLVEITVTWGYQSFTCGFPSIGKEKSFEYFSDFGKELTKPNLKSLTDLQLRVKFDTQTKKSGMFKKLYPTFEAFKASLQ